MREKSERSPRTQWFAVAAAVAMVGVAGTLIAASVPAPPANKVAAQSPRPGPLVIDDQLVVESLADPDQQPPINLDPFDLSCVGPLIVQMASIYSDPPGLLEQPPDPSVAGSLLAVLAEIEDITPPASVEQATPTSAPKTLAISLLTTNNVFVGRSADGRIETIFSLGLVKNEVRITSFTACSQSPLAG